VQFLYEAQLIGFTDDQLHNHAPIINLSFADLSGAHLDYANLSGAHLGFADLGGAQLYHAHLGFAQLSYADLSYADLGYADLSGANLRESKVTLQQLAQAFSLEGTIMPKGSKHP